MSDKEKTPEEKLKDMEKSRNSWKTWGIISIIGAVFCFIVAILLLIFIFKYRSQLKVCGQNIKGAVIQDINNATAKYITDHNLSSLTTGGCGACAITGGCGCSTTGGCGCDMNGGAANSSSFLNKLLKKK